MPSKLYEKAFAATETHFRSEGKRPSWQHAELFRSGYMKGYQDALADARKKAKRRTRKGKPADEVKS